MINLLPPEITYSLGIMLLHMLWQGIIIALCLGTFLIAMRKSSAQSRYFLAVTSILLFPVSAIITYVSVYRNLLITSEISQTLSTMETIKNNSLHGILEAFIDLYDTYLPAIVFIYFIGVTILLLRYFGLLIYVERLKNYLTQPVSHELKDKISSIANRYEIHRKINSKFSKQVNSPMIIGHLRPVLLMPETTLKKLNTHELDVVLQHELAHIKRNDYLVNVFQQIIEILFFFHPAVWWVSSIVRKEREECCDTYAAQNPEEKIVLAKALTTIHEFNIKTQNMALTFLNNKNGLFNRISNLFGKSRFATFREGIIVTIFFFLSIGLMSFMVNENTNTENEEKKLTVLNAQLKDGTHLFAKVDTSGTIEKLFVEGKRIKPRKLHAYKDIIDSLIAINQTTDPVIHNEYISDDRKETVSHEYNKSIEKTISDEIEKEIIKEISKEFNKNSSFNLDINDDDSKVYMNADKNGFYMNIDDGSDKVRLEFSDKGMFIKVKENGKEVVNIDMGVNGFNFKVDDKDSVTNISMESKIQKD